MVGPVERTARSRLLHAAESEPRATRRGLPHPTMVAEVADGGSRSADTRMSSEPRSHARTGCLQRRMRGQPADNGLSKRARGPGTWDRGRADLRAVHVDLIADDANGVGSTHLDESFSPDFDAGSATSREGLVGATASGDPHGAVVA